MTPHALPLAVGSELAAPPSSIGVALLLTVVLLLASAFFSGSETALISLQPLDRQSLADRPRKVVDELLARPRHTIASIIIGNELVNVSLAVVTAGIVIGLFPNDPWVNVVAVTPLLLLFGEVLPKTMALRHNRRVAAAVAPTVRVLSKIIGPVRSVLARIADAALVLTGGSTAPQQAALREEHLRLLIEQGRRSGTIQAIEKEVIDRVFQFGELTVGQLMTPRPDSFTVDLNTPWDELVASIREAGFSRVPIWEEHPDNIIGVLVVKDLLPIMARDNATAPTPHTVRRIVRRARYVPTTKRAEALFSEFRTRRSHLSLVVNEHGTVVGVVTLDDLLNQLMGQLAGEHIDEEPEITEVGEGEFTVRGTLNVSELEEQLGAVFPEGEWSTVGGFVTSLFGDLPHPGQSVQFAEWEFLVVTMDERRIEELTVRRAGKAP